MVIWYASIITSISKDMELRDLVTGLRLEPNLSFSLRIRLCFKGKRWGIGTRQIYIFTVNSLFLNLTLV